MCESCNLQYLFGEHLVFRSVLPLSDIFGSSERRQIHFLFGLQTFLFFFESHRNDLILPNLSATEAEKRKEEHDFLT